MRYINTCNSVAVSFRSVVFQRQASAIAKGPIRPFTHMLSCSKVLPSREESQVELEVEVEEEEEVEAYLK